MTRQALRQQARQKERIHTKLYTYAEVVEISKQAVNEAKNSYDTMYTLAMCSVLESLGFGKKRTYKFFQVFFDMVDSLKSKIVDADDLIKVASNIGVSIRHVNNKFIIELNPSTKKNPLPQKIKRI